MHLEQLDDAGWNREILAAFQDPRSNVVHDSPFILISTGFPASRLDQAFRPGESLPLRTDIAR